MNLKKFETNKLERKELIKINAGISPDCEPGEVKTKNRCEPMSGCYVA